MNTSLTPPREGSGTRARLRGAALGGAALLGAGCVALAGGAVWQLAETLDDVMTWARPSREASRSAAPQPSSAAVGAPSSVAAPVSEVASAGPALSDSTTARAPSSAAPAPSGSKVSGSTASGSAPSGATTSGSVLPTPPSKAQGRPTPSADPAEPIRVATAGRDPAEAFEKAVSLQAPPELELVPSACNDVFVYIVSIAEGAPSQSAASLGVGKKSPARFRRPGQSVGEFDVMAISDDWSGTNPGVWLRRGDEVCRAELDGNAARVHVAPKAKKPKKRKRRARRARPRRRR